MKKFGILSLLLVVSITITGCLNSKKLNTENINTGTSNTESSIGTINDIVDYNNMLKDLATRCTTTENKIIENYNKNDSNADVRQAINDAIKDCENVKNKINKIGSREGDSSLKDGIIAVVEKEIDYFNKFNELLPYLDKEGLNKEEKIIYDTLLYDAESIDQELNRSIEDLRDIQEEFARNHGFKLETQEENVE